MSDEHTAAMSRVMDELRSLLKGTGWYILKLTEDGHAITKWEHFPQYVLDKEDEAEGLREYFLGSGSTGVGSADEEAT